MLPVATTGVDIDEIYRMSQQFVLNSGPTIRPPETCALESPFFGVELVDGGGSRGTAKTP